LCAQQHGRVGGPGHSEASLFARAQSGCARSLDQLMRQYEGLVQAVVRRQVLADLLFDEALQACFCQSKREPFDGRKGNHFGTCTRRAITFPGMFQKVAETRLGSDVYGALMAQTAQRLAQMDRDTEVDSGD